MIYGTFGNKLELVREATVDEVLTNWGSRSRADKTIAKERCGRGMMWWVSGYHTNAAEPRLYNLVYCRADGGWDEIDAARKKIMGEKRYQEAAKRSVA